MLHKQKVIGVYFFLNKANSKHYEGVKLFFFCFVFSKINLFCVRTYIMEPALSILARQNNSENE